MPVNQQGPTTLRATEDMCREYVKLEALGRYREKLGKNDKKYINGVIATILCVVYH